MKTVLFGITGGIAAYKSAMIASTLNQKGYNVLTIMTENATKFITPLTLEVLTKNPVAIDTFERIKSWEVEHISWAKKADILLVAPATANFIAKYAYGIADDMLTTTALACACPVILAPAMNDNMYNNIRTQKNIMLLQEYGVEFIPPSEGYLAEGIHSIGRMEDVNIIVEKVMEIIAL